MNTEESSALYKRIFVVSPDLPVWVKDKSLDASATLLVWRNMLEYVPAEVGDRVVRELETGERSMPEAYDRGKFGNVLRSWCMKIVDTECRKNRDEQVRDEGRRRTSVTETDPGLMVAYRKSVATAELLREGRISAEENTRRVRRAQWEMPHNDWQRRNGTTFEQWIEGKERPCVQNRDLSIVEDGFSRLAGLEKT